MPAAPSVRPRLVRIDALHPPVRGAVILYPDGSREGVVAPSMDWQPAWDRIVCAGDNPRPNRLLDPHGDTRPLLRRKVAPGLGGFLQEVRLATGLRIPRAEELLGLKPKVLRVYEIWDYSVPYPLLEKMATLYAGAIREQAEFAETALGELIERHNRHFHPTVRPEVWRTERGPLMIPGKRDARLLTLATRRPPDDFRRCLLMVRLSRGWTVLDLARAVREEREFLRRVEETDDTLIPRPAFLERIARLSGEDLATWRRRAHLTYAPEVPVELVEGADLFVGRQTDRRLIARLVQAGAVGPGRLGWELVRLRSRFGGNRSSQEAARVEGIHPRLRERYEKGESRPGDEPLQRIAAVHRVPFAGLAAARAISFPGSQDLTEVPHIKESYQFVTPSSAGEAGLAPGEVYHLLVVQRDANRKMPEVAATLLNTIADVVAIHPRLIVTGLFYGPDRLEELADRMRHKRFWPRTDVDVTVVGRECHMHFVRKGKGVGGALFQLQTDRSGSWERVDAMNELLTGIPRRKAAPAYGEPAEYLDVAAGLAGWNAGKRARLRQDLDRRWEHMSPLDRFRFMRSVPGLRVRPMLRRLLPGMDELFPGALPLGRVAVASLEELRRVFARRHLATLLEGDPRAAYLRLHPEILPFYPILDEAGDVWIGFKEKDPKRLLERIARGETGGLFMDLPFNTEGRPLVTP